MQRRLVAIAGVPVWAWLWIRYYVRERTARTPALIHRGVSQSTGLWCICAVYQPKRTSANLVAFAAGLQAAGYNVIAVHNGPAAADLAAALTPFCHTVMVRWPGGRDFGSYKVGTAYLGQMAAPEDIRQVIYCNDSVFVRPEALSRLLASLPSRADDYIGLLESFPFHHHIASWFFAVSGTVFRSSYFQSFWKAYVPTSHRARGVAKGEVGLTRCLIESGVYPRILFSAGAILDRLSALDKPALAAAVILLSNQRTYEILKPDQAALSSPFAPGVAGSMGRLGWDMLDALMIHQSSAQGGIEFFQLLLLRFCDFPFVKKDVVYHDAYHCIQLERAVEGWAGGDSKQLDEILGYVRRRGSLRWHGLWHRLRVAWGIAA